MCHMCEAKIPHQCQETGAYEHARSGVTYRESGRPLTPGPVPATMSAKRGTTRSSVPAGMRHTTKP